MKDNFTKALENNDIFEMRKVPKGDLHNHGTRGGNKKYMMKLLCVTSRRYLEKLKKTD